MKKLILIFLLSSVGSFAQNCLLTYQTKLDQLLPLAMIQKHYKGDMSKAKKQYNFRPTAKYHDTDTYEYVWPSNRKVKMKMLGREMEVEESNRLGLTWVGNDMFMMPRKSTPLENFKFYYRNLTTKEKEEAFKKTEETMKNKGYSEQQTKTATNMAKDLSADEVMFRIVAGIGDAAVWRIKEKSLIVLTGKSSFQVVANISEKEDKNIELAKKLADEVLSKCK